MTAQENDNTPLLQGEPNSTTQVVSPQTEYVAAPQAYQNAQEHQPYNPQPQPAFANPAPLSGFSVEYIQPQGASPILAALLSFFVLPGVGHVYAGQHNKGLSIIIMYLILSFSVVLLCLLLIGYCLLPLLFVYNIFIALDVLNIANRLERGIPVKDGECTNTIATVGLGMFSFIKGSVFVNEDHQSNVIAVC
ncbi:mutL [Acrasis kona]|uniref:MutL n=1 Tax=Acrasis kona TaxID=1008807 RepID=A0AAW2ZAT8_9EUKA